MKKIKKHSLSTSYPIKLLFEKERDKKGSDDEPGEKDKTDEDSDWRILVMKKMFREQEGARTKGLFMESPIATCGKKQLLC